MKTLLPLGLTAGGGADCGALDRSNFSPRIAASTTKTSVRVIDPRDCEGVVYYLPTPKSPHGVDLDPTGEYIVAGGKLATVIPVHSFTKLAKAAPVCENKNWPAAPAKAFAKALSSPAALATATTSIDPLLSI